MGPRDGRAIIRPVPKINLTRLPSKRVPPLGPGAIGDFEERLRSAGVKLGPEGLGYWGRPASYLGVSRVAIDPLLIWDSENPDGMIHIGKAKCTIEDETWTVYRAILSCGRSLQDGEPGSLGDTTKGNWKALVPLIPKGKTAPHEMPVRAFCSMCERDFIISVAQSNAIIQIRKQMQDAGMRGGPVRAIYWGSDSLFGYRDQDGVFQPIDDRHDFEIESAAQDAGDQDTDVDDQSDLQEDDEA